MVSVQDDVTSFDPPVVPSLPVLSAQWAEEDCKLLGCLKSDNVGSVRVQYPVAYSSLQSVKMARSKGPELASISTCSCLVVSAQQALNLNLKSSLSPIETQQANANRFTLLPVVNDELRVTIR